MSIPINEYLKRLADGGVSVVVVNGQALALSEFEPTMGNESSGLKPLPEGTKSAITKRNAEIVEFFANEETYPYLTPDEVALSELVLDMLDDDELDRLARHKASDCQTVRKGIVGRIRGGRRETRKWHPEFHTTPQDARDRAITDSLARLERAQRNHDASTWEFDKSEAIKWVKRRKPDGKLSLHYIGTDRDGDPLCDCEAKKIRPMEPCVHEIARANEIMRREQEAIAA